MVDMYVVLLNIAKFSTEIVTFCTPSGNIHAYLLSYNFPNPVLFISAVCLLIEKWHCDIDNVTISVKTLAVLVESLTQATFVSCFHPCAAGS